MGIVGIICYETETIISLNIKLYALKLFSYNSIC